MPALGMRPLGEHMDVEGFDTSRVSAAFAVVQDKKFAPRQSVPRVIEVTAESPNKASLLDLNIKPATQTTATHLFDVVHDVTAELNLAEVRGLMKKNSYSSLPPPLRPSAEIHVPYTMQLNISPVSADGKRVIVKWYMFDEKQHVHKVRDALIQGICHEPQWIAASHNRQVTKVRVCNGWG